MSDSELLELREQFSTPEQQQETSSIGMWVFLITEVMLFGGLFMAFTIYRTSYPVAFDAGSAHMEWVIGAANTGILLCSSLMMALAVYNSEQGNNKWVMIFLVLAMALGAIFLGLKLTEYYDHWVERKVPGFWFEYSGGNAGKVELFFVFYFVMTGLHAIHLTIGICILAVLFFRTWMGRFSAAYHTPIDLGGLYWHFIDVVWVFLYAIFYIEGLHVR